MKYFALLVSVVIFVGCSTLRTEESKVCYEIEIRDKSITTEVANRYHHELKMLFEKENLGELYGGFDPILGVDGQQGWYTEFYTKNPQRAVSLVKRKLGELKILKKSSIEEQGEIHVWGPRPVKE